MTKQRFQDTFVAQFCATWAAVHYNEFCAAGRQEQLANPPIEDAEFLAEAAWKKLEQHRTSTGQEPGPPSLQTT